MRTTMLLAALTVLALALVALLPHPAPVNRVTPAARFAATAPTGVWDSVAVLDAEVWVTDTARGEIVVVDWTAKKEKRRIGGEAGLRNPNGIAALRSPPGPWVVFVADPGSGAVVRLAQDGTVLGRFGPGLVSNPVGVTAVLIDGTPHLFVAGSRAAGEGLVWHGTLPADALPAPADGGDRPTTLWTASVPGEIESMAVLVKHELVFVANESGRDLVAFNLTTGEALGKVGSSDFRGEPEGLVARPDGTVVVAVDQTRNDGRLVTFEGNRPGARILGTDPPLASPDGMALGGGSIFVVVGDREVWELRAADVGL